MLEISDLGLSFFQAIDVENTDPQLVTAWLEAASGPGVRSPRAFFLAGLKSGEPPYVFGDDGDRVHAVVLAERWIENAGLYCDRAEEVIDELFGRNGLLREHAADVRLQKRMLDLWAKGRPTGEQVEREAIERAQRNATTYHALYGKEAKREPAGDQGRAEG